MYKLIAQSNYKLQRVFGSSLVNTLIKFQLEERIENSLLSFLKDFFYSHNYRIFYFNDLVLLCEYLFAKAIKLEDGCAIYFELLNEVVSLGLIPKTHRSIDHIAMTLAEIIDRENVKAQLSDKDMEHIDNLLMVI